MILFLCTNNLTLASNTFTLVIDPGHGGKDPGALGKYGREKDVTLKVALLTGKLIQEKHKDVKVVYTRSTDLYLTLKERPAIANKNDGDFFISIHANASEAKSAYGTETYTLGLHKSSANFEVAKRENSVMLLEEDNEVTYQNFNPQSPDSYIMFEMATDIYRDQSVILADFIQKEFVKRKRSDRGVRQAGFWVLHQVKMPSILIELGFMSNTNEEQYLISKKGQQELANSICIAFDKYKHEYDKKNTCSLNQSANSSSNIVESKSTDKTTTTKSNSKYNIDNSIVFKIQSFSSKIIVPKSHRDYKKIAKYSPVKYTLENGWYKYTCGDTSNYDEITEIKNDLKKVLPDVFIVAFKNGEKIPLSKALIQIKK